MLDTSHKCFISFKTEDIEYKKAIQNDLNIKMIDKSLNSPIASENNAYVMEKIRTDYLNDSSVTIVLIGTHSAENDLRQDQRYIKRELQASLYKSKKSGRNGILGVVLPNMYNTIYLGEHTCPICGEKHCYLNINDNTIIKEFSVNYFIHKDYGCAWKSEDRYCILKKWDDFVKNPEKCINQAFEKRFEPIANKVKVFPK